MGNDLKVERLRAKSHYYPPLLLSNSMALCLSPSPRLLYKLSLFLHCPVQPLSTPHVKWCALSRKNKAILNRERNHLFQNAIRKVAFPIPTAVMFQPVWWAFRLVVLTGQKGVL